MNPGARPSRDERLKTFCFSERSGLRSSEGPVKVVGIERGESRGGYWEGEPPESFNPMDGFGMKQGRADDGGMKRHKVEKA